MASFNSNIHSHVREIHRERPIGEVLNDVKTELKDFIQTRVQMLRSEMNDKVGAVKVAAPSIVVGALMGIAAFSLITLALVFLVSMAFEGQPWQYALSFGIVGIIYAIVAAVAIGYGISTIKARGMTPDRTLRVLKQDQVWAETEAKTQL